jgi:hypothetical protein
MLFILSVVQSYIDMAAKVGVVAKVVEAALKETRLLQETATTSELLN